MKKGFTIKTFFDSYKIEEQVGQGGCATVFRVTNGVTDYAMKVLNEEKSGSEKVKRFKNEMNFCYSQNNANIIKVYDYGIAENNDNKYLFYIMPYYKKTLRKELKEELTIVKRMNLISDLLDGIEFAHSLGVIHRDLKPENIMVTEEGHAVISDFGIAHFTEELQITTIETKQSSRMANFQYAAPEQRIINGKITFASDIYALGLMLNEMFTGKIPVGTEYKKIVEVDKDLSYLDDIVSKMIRQSPENRYRSIGELKREIINMKSAYESLNKIDKLKSINVIKDSSVDDLAENPPKLVDFDWNNSQLTLILDKSVNKKWIEAFNNMGSYSSCLGYEPYKFNINGNNATISNVRSNSVQGIIDYFKDWLNIATSKYKNLLESEKIDKYNKEQKALQERILKEEERLRVLSSIKL